MKKRPAGFAALLALGIGPFAASPGDGVHVRTTAELAPCVRAALAARPGAPAHLVEVGEPTKTEGADIVVDEELRLTRTLEAGHADDRTLVDLHEIPRRAHTSRVVAALVTGTLREAAGRRVLAALGHAAARDALSRCMRARTEPATEAPAFAPPESAGASAAAEGAAHATAVVDWWLPACTLARNGYNDPSVVLGPPDARNLGGGRYSGFFSLGQGGYVTVDMGQTVTARPGPDIRVYQSVSLEPVTLYASSSPNGPFRLVAACRFCGERTPGAFSNHCDFDLAEGGLSSARYLRVEDCEIYPCLAGDTDSEGADIDAVEAFDP
jgi:hypothetical protein